MSPPDSALQMSRLHKELAQLANCRTFYTTNFDDFLERSFRLNGRCVDVIAVEAQMGGQYDDCQIVKFHGDWDHPDHIVLTELEYEKRIALSTPIDYRLKADLLGSVILFVGYSFRDPNVSYLFQLFTDEVWGRASTRPGTRAYIIVPNPSDF